MYTGIIICVQWNYIFLLEMASQKKKKKQYLFPGKLNTSHCGFLFTLSKFGVTKSRHICNLRGV